MRSVPDIDIVDADPLLGRELDGRWVVLEPLARGGMGTVYRGAHLELGRAVAIKVLSHAQSASEEAVLRFLREARTAAEIDHPNIAPILDLGRLESGAPYLVMELLEGEDLAEVIAREAPMPLSRILELLGPVAQAIDAVHAAGLLHRDIKPANVFLAQRPDGRMMPTLVDFGLATRIESENSGEERRLTREGVVVGTPHYVSPEAAEGAPIDARSDIYSLGLIVFEMLTGLLPIDGDDALTLLVERVRKPAPSLSGRSGRSFPLALERVMADTLSRRVERRPATAHALIAQLAELDGHPEANPPEPSAHIEEPSAPGAPIRPSTTRRRRLGLALAALVMMLSVGLLAPWSMSSEPEIVARPLPRRSERVPAPVPSEAPEARASAEVQSSTEASPTVEPIPTPRPSPPDATSSLPARPRDPARAVALVEEGRAAFLRGRFPQARTLFRQAADTDRTHADAWRGLGIASERMGLIPEAATAYRRYLALNAGASDAAQVRERLERLERVGG